MTHTYVRKNVKLVGCYRDGKFLCWLEQNSRRSAGLNQKRYVFWSCLLDGKVINASTLTILKQKIEGKVDLTTGRLITS